MLELQEQQTYEADYPEKLDPWVPSEPLDTENGEFEIDDDSGIMEDTTEEPHESKIDLSDIPDIREEFDMADKDLKEDVNEIKGDFNEIKVTIAELETKVSNIDDKFTRLLDERDKRFDELNKSIEKVNEQLGQRIAETNNHLANRIDDLAIRLEESNKQLGKRIEESNNSVVEEISSLISLIKDRFN